LKVLDLLAENTPREYYNQADLNIIDISVSDENILAIFIDELNVYCNIKF
jgi:hypothetical protein